MAAGRRRQRLAERACPHGNNRRKMRDDKRRKGYRRQDEFHEDLRSQTPGQAKSGTRGGDRNVRKKIPQTGDVYFSTAQE
jgi:hypothetical protein